MVPESNDEDMLEGYSQIESNVLSRAVMKYVMPTLDQNPYNKISMSP